MTAARFRHELARLGRFTGRKSDGKAGWQVLWRGWHQLSPSHPKMWVTLSALAREDVNNGFCVSCQRKSVR